MHHGRCGSRSRNALRPLRQDAARLARRRRNLRSRDGLHRRGRRRPSAFGRRCAIGTRSGSGSRGRLGGGHRRPLGRRGCRRRSRRGRNRNLGSRSRRNLRGGNRSSPSPDHVRNRGVPALQRLDALGKSLQRQVGIGPHHARERDLERQTRVRRRLQLGRQVAQHAQQARQAVRAEQRQLARKLAPHGFAHLERHVGARQRQHVHVAHMLGQIAHELRQIRTRFHVLRRPAEARGHVARTDCAHDLGQVVRVDGAQ